MSARFRVVNTAPLIFLAKLGHLEILRLHTDQVLVPTAVLGELRVGGDEATERVEQVLGDWLQEQGCTQEALLASVAASLDPGEAEVVALALEIGTRDVVLDDMQGRRFARRSGLRPIGTLGLLLAAKNAGQLASVGAEIQELERFGFRASTALVQRVLQAAGELDRSTE